MILILKIYKTSCPYALILITQVWPVIVWAIVVIIMNAVNYALLKPVASSIALLNLIHFGIDRHNFCLFAALDAIGDNVGLKSISYNQAYWQVGWFKWQMYLNV